MSRILVLILALVSLASCRDRSEKLFDQAQAAMEADHVEMAARHFQELTIQTPASPLAAEAHFELAHIYYLRLRDVDAAKDSLVKLLQDYPDSNVDVDAKRLLARLYTQDFQEHEKAVKLYRELLSRGLDEATRRHTLLDIADCHYRLGELDASANAYRLAIALPYDADTDSAYLRLATLEWLNGSPDESVRLLRELQERTADAEHRHESILSEVEVLMSLGRFDAARERADVARERFPESLDVIDLKSRLTAAEAERRSLDGESEQSLLQEEQKKIRWGGARRRRR